MPNQSFLSWQGVLRCDGPQHKSLDPGRPDWIYDAADTAGEYKSAARHDGWQFKRDGRVFCPDCVKSMTLSRDPKIAEPKLIVAEKSEVKS